MNANSSNKLRIAIDLRALGGPSGFRGIGVYIRSVLPELLAHLQKDSLVTLYAYTGTKLDFIDTKAVKVVFVDQPATRSLSKSIQKLLSGISPQELRSTKSLPKIDEQDLFFQPYAELGIPKYVPSVTFCHDLIPLVFEREFFNKKAGISPLSWVLAARSKLQKRAYLQSLESIPTAQKILTNSEHTKQDLSDRLGVENNKIVVTPLASKPPHKYLRPKDLPADITKNNYIIYIGGTDTRRDLEGLIKISSNIHKSTNIKLVLAGRDFEYVKRPSLAAAIKEGNQQGSLVTLGYLDEPEKNYLIKNSLALVLPSVYEGFGLPVLDAFANSTAVITYDNSSLREVGADAAIYAKNIKDMQEKVIRLANNPSFRSKHLKLGRQQLQNFSWSKTAEQTANELIKCAESNHND